MGGTPRVDPVKLLAAVLWREDAAMEDAVRLLRARWGEIDFHGPAQPFDLTDYYEREMGIGLRRSVLSFETLIPPESLTRAKLEAVEIEEALRGPSGRRVNIDPGYLDLHKVVLASLKYGAMKIHLGEGVYADLICRFSERRFQHLEWTFQDFKAGTYDADLLRIREIYRAQLRAGA